jgi:hypothetical protein
MTMFDQRTKLSEQVVQEVQRYFGDLVYGVIIPRTVRLSEAPGFGQPITVYDARSKGAEAYRSLAREVALRPPPDAPMPSFDELAVPVMTPGEDLVSAGEPVNDNGAGSSGTEQRADDAVDLEHAAPATAPRRARRRPGPAPVRPAEEVRPEPQAEVEPPPPPPEPREPPPPAAGSEPSAWEEPPPEPEPRVKPLSRPPPPGELPERRVVVIDEQPDRDIEASREEPPPPPGADEHAAGLADIGEQLGGEKGRRRRWRMFRKGGA